jgi:hypothetical protein
MRPVLALLVLSLAVPAAAAPSREITLQRVTGKGTNPQAQAIASAWTGRAVAVELRDARTGDPAVVGAQQEKGILLYEWKSTQPVPEGVQSMIEQTLKSWGVGVNPGSAIRLEVTLEALRIDEVPETFGSSYRAEVTLKGGVFDPDGHSTMPGRVVSGSGKKTGPDRRAKLCNEAFTAALEDAVAKMMTPLEVTTPKPTLTADATDPNAVPAKEMLKELLKLKDAGVGEPVMLGYVRQRRLTAPLSADDIVKWKDSGLPESVIHAAQEIK